MINYFLFGRRKEECNVITELQSLRREGIRADWWSKKRLAINSADFCFVFLFSTNNQHFLITNSQNHKNNLQFRSYSIYSSFLNVIHYYIIFVNYCGSPVMLKLCSTIQMFCSPVVGFCWEKWWCHNISCVIQVLWLWMWCYCCQIKKLFLICYRWIEMVNLSPLL